MRPFQFFLLLLSLCCGGCRKIHAGTPIKASVMVLDTVMYLPVLPMARNVITYAAVAYFYPNSGYVRRVIQDTLDVKAEDTVHVSRLRDQSMNGR